MWSEWNICKTRILPYKTSPVILKFIANKILGIMLMVLYNYLICAVDKTTGTTHTTNINYDTNYGTITTISVLSFFGDRSIAIAIDHPERCKGNLTVDRHICATLSHRFLCLIFQIKYILIWIYSVILPIII